MSLIHDVNDIQLSLDNLKNKAKEQQKLYFSIITGVVSLHQEYRIAKNYEVSDKLRELLNNNGINIIQGTKQYGSFENIPKSLLNNTVNDRWGIKE